MIPAPEDLSPLPAESPSMLGRVGEQFANAPSDILNDLMRLGFNLGIKDPEQTEAISVPTPYSIPEARTGGEMAVDIVSNVVKSLPLFLSGEGAGVGVARIAGAGKTLANMMRVGGGFAAQGLSESPEQAAADATMGAGFGAVESMLPGPMKLLAAGALGLGTGLEAKRHGASDTMATVSGLTNAILPLVTGRRRAPTAATERAIEAEPQTAQYLTYPARPLLEDVQSTRRVPGTGGPIEYGGELPESTTRARPIFGTERFPIQEAEFVDVPRNGHAPALLEPPRAITPLKPVDLPNPMAPPGSLVRDTSITTAERNRALGVTAPEGSLIREATFTEGEALRYAEGKQPKVATLQSETPTPPIKPKSTGRVLLSTVLSEENKALVEKSAAKLGLEFKGFWPGTNHIEFKFPEGTDHPASGANITLNPNSTFKDLKNKVAEKTKQFAAESSSQGKKVGEEIESKPPTEVATLQPQVSGSSAPLPSSLETTLPHGLKVGDTASVMFEGERLVGTILGKGEGDTIRVHTKAYGELDRPMRDISLPGVRSGSNAPIKSVGGLDDLEKLGTEPQGGFTKVGGGKMKLSNFGEHGAIDPELLHILGRYVAPSAIGAGVGYAEDDQHRLGSAVAGAAIGGTLGHFGGKLIRLLAEGHPEVKKAGSMAERLSKIGTAVKEDTVRLAKAVTGNEEMAAKAASRWGLADSYDHLARWIEKNVVFTPSVVRFMDKAHGKIEVLSETMRTAIGGLRNYDGIDRHFDDLNRYFEGRMTTAELSRKVPTEVVQMAATAMQARTALQNIAVEGLGKGKLSNAINDSIGKYLTTAYKVFHDPKYMPTDAQIEAAARSLTNDWGSLATRMDLLHDYIHEIKANKGMVGGFSKTKGESLSALLSRKQDLTPEFKEMLGVYESPIERMGHTAVKLVNASRSAEFFNEVSNGVKANGLKFAYTGAEREGIIATLQSRARLAHSPVEREAAAAQLKEVQDYVWNSSGAANGRLGGTFIDRRMRDQLAHYDAASKLFSSPLAQHFANVTNLIKYGQVILSPLQFVRQVYSMPVLGIMAKTTPIDWLRAFKTINDKSEVGLTELTRLKQLGVYGGDPVGGMLRKDMRNMMEGKLDGVIHERLRHGLHKWEEFWRQPDLIVRVSAFQRKEAELLEKYGSGGADRAANEAIDHMNRYTMNYGAVPPIVQKGRQMPFINQYLSFAYEAARIAKNLGQDALKGDVYAMGALATVATAPFIIQQMSEAALSPSDREEWAKVKNLGKDYERHNFRFVMGRQPNGDFRYILFSPLVPHDPWLQSVRAVMAGDTDALKAANPVFGWENTPLLNVASSLTAGRNRLSGDKLYTFADYAESIRRDVAPILLGTDLDRIKRALMSNEEGGRGVIDTRTGKVSSASDIIQTYATSMRPYTVRPAYLLHQAQAEAVDRINQQQRAYRSVMATNASADVKAQAKDNFDRALQHILLAFKEKYGVSLTPTAEAGPSP